MISYMVKGTRPANSMPKHSQAREQADLERLAAMGKFTAKVAHELNNPLDGIMRYINLARRSVEQGQHQKVSRHLDQSQKGLMRMAQVVSELLEFSRGRYALPDEPAPLGQIVEDAIGAIAGQCDSDNVKIVKNFSPDIPMITAGNLFQVFCNLIKNAFDSMPDGGILEVTTREEPGGIISAEFRDTGSGFDPANEQTIFEPFFTTKERDKGTGLGLAICKDLVERHGGHITAENCPQNGSVFTVYLPGPKVTI